jgi:hypothetical protein
MVMSRKDVADENLLVGVIRYYERRELRIPPLECIFRLGHYLRCPGGLEIVHDELIHLLIREIKPVHTPLADVCQAKVGLHK